MPLLERASKLFGNFLRNLKKDLEAIKPYDQAWAINPQYSNYLSNK